MQNHETFKLKCFKCHKVGHKASECRKSQNNDSSSSANAEEEKVPVQSLAAHTKNEEKVLNCEDKDKERKTRWILDSGCTAHLCKDKERFNDLSQTACDTLQMASYDSIRIAGEL